MLPEPPATFRRPSASERPWWWRLETADGTEVAPGGDAADLADQRFANQADAESWVGEVFGRLAEAGVDQVVLHEHDRRVYGPMSLHP
ncbi:hypothetical protein [Nocardioides litoris]|uniref:hypothetical protein n=1 Tax=Nocardioides litoris TaxID=1926648 RepID=UPI001B85C108|nr:hypothetical protein [Nocardioides litoris]